MALTRIFENGSNRVEDRSYIRIMMNWHERFTYDEATGNLFHKARPIEVPARRGGSRSWNTRWAGREVTNRARDGSYVTVNYRPHPVHRIVWEMFKGEIPDGLVIDHVNGDCHDNRLSNLRLATVSQNTHNQKKRSDNTSGFKGVSRVSRGSKWIATIKAYGKKQHIGTFNCPFAAHVA